MKEIEKIINAYDKVNWDKEQAALGTVVKVEESSYRRIGARMFVTSQGHWTGGISGGCLEGDALKRAQIAMSRNQRSVVVYDTMDDDSHQIGIGLGCNGRIEVMFTPINQADKKNPIEFLRTITSTREAQVLMQILDASENNSDLVGNFYPQHNIDQLIADTNLSSDQIEMGISEARKKRKSRTFRMRSVQGKDYEILVELIKPKIKAICVGDNYDVNAFAGIAQELGWEMHVVGKKRKMSKTLFDLAKGVYEGEDVKNIGIDDYTAVILMSHDYKTDLKMLQYFYDKPVKYIGLLGPKKRTQKMQDEWASAAGIHLDEQDNIFSPVGLDLGSESPEEIALSITAEIISLMNGRDSRSLRNREGPIHPRE